MAILYCSLNADGEISEVEIDRLSHVLVFKSLFREYNLVELYKKVAYAYPDFGGKYIIEQAAKFVSEDNKQTLFAIMLDLLLSDGVFENKEIEVSEIVAKALGLTDETASKIIDVIMAKNKGNVIVISEEASDDD